MKKLFLMSTLLTVIVGIKAVTITNNTGLEAYIEVSYVTKCSGITLNNVGKFEQQINSGTTVDISSGSVQLSGIRQQCQTDIDTLKATITLSDGTQISRTWTQDELGRKASYILNSNYNANTILPPATLYIR